MMAAAATLAVLAGVGVGGWVIGQSNSDHSLQEQIADSKHQLAQQQALLAIMASPDAKIASSTVDDGGTVTVASSQKANQAAVMVKDMPAPPPGKTYELWFISPTGAVRAGLMPGTQGNTAAMQVLDGPMGGATHVGITVEPDGGSPKPTTTPILVQAL
ncbi:MAG: anti-sigma factor, partial [Specibacter sp.]